MNIVNADPIRIVLLVRFKVIFYANHTDLAAIGGGHDYESEKEVRKNTNPDNRACIEIRVDNDNRNDCSSQAVDIYSHIHN